MERFNRTIQEEFFQRNDGIFYLHFPIFSFIIFLMPTEMRLLYILSDLAYIAKLNAAKKAHEFTLADFRQINGEFMDENVLLSPNLAKLLAKLEAGSYKLILPDFLFTSTIVNLELDNEEAVKTHLKEKLLPDLGINETDYYLDTTVLSNYKGSFKVQLTALEKSVAAPLAEALKKFPELKIESISPLSWASKSLISLEPSVAILQMGGNLFLAQHYIGVDQCYSVEVAEAENFAETVKTLKGAEPSLQTVYLLTNSLVDDAIKEKLKETLPVQQIADLASENEAMPSYVRQIIEACAKTFSIPEFLLPKFALDEKYQAQASQVGSEVDNLVKPAVVGASSLPTPVTVSSAANIGVAVESLDEEEVSPMPKVVAAKPEVVETKKTSAVEPAEEVELKEEPIITEEKEIDFSQFANLALDPSVFEKKAEVVDDKAQSKQEMTMPENLPNKVVIKNQNDGGGVAKMIFIGFLSFVITIALGVGLGMAYLQFSNSKEDTKPVVELEPTVTPEVEEVATPAPLPEIDKADYKLLVVNATTKAGYAGTVATKVRAADFKEVEAKNAKGIYEEMDYLLVKEDTPANQALLKELETATGLKLTLSTEIEEEDSAGAYDAVLVLGL